MSRILNKLCGLLLTVPLSNPALMQAASRLQISPNKHFLVKEDGSPFFYLADTAWELFHRLNRDEAELYLTNRAAQGFTVIQAVVLAELDGLKVPNAYGEVPFEDLDPAKPNEAYFQQIDHVLNKAASLDLYMGMLPTWGDKFSKKWGAGPEVFTEENARAYGEFLGKRYKDKPVIWILGGDRNPENDKHLAVIRAMAQGLKQSDGGNHLLTYHPQGAGNSARWFHKDDWLDFNSFQSGHAAASNPNYRFALDNYKLSPPKPTLDSEARYEDHPIDWKPDKGWFDDWDVRQAAYWSMLSGAAGHTYGNHNVWQFFEPNRHKPISFARAPWKKALEQPGAIQMGYMRKLFESRPWQKLVPDQSLVAGMPGEGADHVRCARAEDGSFLFIYTPMGRSLPVKLNATSGSAVKAFWFDPRAGTNTVIGEFANTGTRTFEPPASGRGNDWELVLDDPARKFPNPVDKN